MASDKVTIKLDFDEGQMKEIKSFQEEKFAEIEKRLMVIEERQRLRTSVVKAKCCGCGYEMQLKVLTDQNWR
jgi:hypothetical protein